MKRKAKAAPKVAKPTKVEGASAPKAKVPREEKKPVSVSAQPVTSKPAIPSISSQEAPPAPPNLQSPPVKKAPEPPPESKPAQVRKRRLSKPGLPRTSELKVPAILLEGDQSPKPPSTGPGARYALAPQPLPTERRDPGELPEAYGTGRIFLAARDPHWLYASWDFTHDQQRHFNELSRDGHMVLRIFAADESEPIIPEVHVHPESKNWFVNVPLANTRYRAELGFYNSKRAWVNASTSQATLTPPEAPSTETHSNFATVPPDISFQQVVEAVESIVEHVASQPLLEAVAIAAAASLERSSDHNVPSGNGEPSLASPVQSPPAPPSAPGRGDGRSFYADFDRTPEKPAPASKKRGRKPQPLPVTIEAAPEWQPERREALKRLIHMDSYRRVWLGSIEITELVRRALEEEIASIAAIEAKRLQAQIPPGKIPLEAISSPIGGELPRDRKFWFKVNAELIIYGSTEPDARVTIADRPIKLRPDGTFTFRFSLPDGRYQLPAVAVSSDGEEGREARLEFSRSTEIHGHVEAHPQDASLRPPHAEHLR